MLKTTFLKRGAPPFGSDDLSKTYNDCYDLNRRHMNKDKLISHINPKFKYVNSNYEFNYIPVYGYVSSSECLSRTSELLLHLAIVFNVLAHQDKFPDINNQESIASFNVIMEAKEHGTTAEAINETKIKDMAYYKAKAKGLKRIIIGKDETIDKKVTLFINGIISIRTNGVVNINIISSDLHRQHRLLLPRVNTSTINEDTRVSKSTIHLTIENRTL